MAFPNPHAWPYELPLWTIDNHQLTAGERVEPTPFDQGEDRHRETRTFTPFLASVSTKRFTQAQYDRFSAWFEADLQAGAQRFDCPVHSVSGGGSVQWWQALFLGPPRVQAFRARYVITAELILLDGPYAGGTGPGTVGDVRVALSLAGRSNPDAAHRASFAATSLMGRSNPDSELWAISTNSLRGRTNPDSELLGTLQPQGFLLLPDGVSYLLLPGGSGRLALPE